MSVGIVLSLLWCIQVYKRNIGKFVEYRRLYRIISCLAFFYQRDASGADSKMFYDWAVLFPEGVNSFRNPVDNMVIIYDGQACHIQ